MHQYGYTVQYREKWPVPRINNMTVAATSSQLRDVSTENLHENTRGAERLKAINGL